MKTLLIQSFSDIITNSSTEVFMVKSSKTLEEFNESLTWQNFTIFNTEEDVKSYILKHSYNLYKLDNFLEKNPLAELDYVLDEEFLKTIGKTKDEIFEFFKKPYIDGLLGKAIYSFMDDCPYPKEVNDVVKFIHQQEDFKFDRT